ncbi:IS110 family transposase [Mammaliicoccus fleurettii]|nr:IS110 family transposase [Staphylococcus schleiferi]QPA25306.1 IS110 family transposase [Mammaliicoccus fleurettii]MBF2105883.1 IS110 family transposase [Staphylococcus schleiferi]MBF2108030.1 IS110 family transposase [Staphylococcus schleiferi]MBF2110178.1 IS110 family transposase [Staphylococcus schleiferi]
MSKRSSVVAHYHNDQFQREFTIQNNKNGYNYLLKYLNDLDHLQIIFESTGIYSRGMTRFCRVNQINYIEMNPLEAKFRTSSLRSWKTDQADAHKLALLAFNMKDAKIQRHTEEIYFELRERARFHLEMENDQNKLKVELVEVLHQTFPGLEKLFKNRYSKIALNIAKVFPHPNCVFALTHDELTHTILNSTAKGMSIKKAQKYTNDLISIAQNSFPTVKQSSFLVEKLRHLCDKLLKSMHEKDLFDKEMIKLAKTTDAFENIVSIPGLGELTTALLIGELGDITHFETNKQLNAYVGIDIKRYQSGNSMSRDTINKRGNKKARRLLFLIIMNIIRGRNRYKNHVADYYYKLRKQPNEKPHKTAVIASVNRLLKTIHYLITNNQLYDYQKAPH